MQNLLTNFRAEFLDRLLDVLWRQWTALGVSGRGQTWTGPTIDPDALLLLSCTIARYYKLQPETWRDLFVGKESKTSWVVWAHLFSALEQVWLFLDQHDLASQSALAQASSLRRILKHSVASRLDRSGSVFMFGDDSARPGEALIPFFVAHMRTMLDWAGQSSSNT